MEGETDKGGCEFEEEDVSQGMWHQDTEIATKENLTEELKK